MARTRVKIDRRKYDAFMRRARRIEATKISVGQATRARYPDGTDVALVAQVLEERSGFTEAALVGRRDDRKMDVETLRRHMVIGGDIRRDLRRIGRKDRDAIREKIRESGHVDTGRLLRSTVYVVGSGT